MLMALEENFGITVSDEEALTLKTIRDVAEFIEGKAE
jgi:acyl carrier protein